MLQGPIQDTTLQLAVVSSRPSWLWQCLTLLVSVLLTVGRSTRSGILQDVHPLGFACSFSHDQPGVICPWKEAHRAEGPFSSRLIEGASYQQDLSRRPGPPSPGRLRCKSWFSQRLAFSWCPEVGVLSSAEHSRQPAWVLATERRVRSVG